MRELIVKFLGVDILSPDVSMKECDHDKYILKGRVDMLWVGSDLDAFMTIPNSEIDSFEAFNEGGTGILEAAVQLKARLSRG